MIAKSCLSETIEPILSIKFSLEELSFEINFFVSQFSVENWWARNAIQGYHFGFSKIPKFLFLQIPICRLNFFLHGFSLHFQLWQSFLICLFISFRASERCSAENAKTWCGKESLIISVFRPFFLQNCQIEFFNPCLS